MLGRQLHHPQGVFGSGVGTLMRVINSRPNALAIAALELQPTDEVLELGCGPGHAVSMIAKQLRAGTIHAVDQSETMLAQARSRNRLAIQEGRVRLYRARIEQLPFADGSMDRVLAVNVAYFWPDPAAVLSEINRMLRPGGALSIYVTDASVMRRWPFADAATHRHFRRCDLAEALQRGGFCEAMITSVAMPLLGDSAGLLAIGRKRPCRADVA